MSQEEYFRVIRQGIARNETIAEDEKAFCPTGDTYSYNNLSVEGAYRIDGTVLVADTLLANGRITVNGKLETGGW